jgi:DNA repair protein RecO (recombination protein O)
LAVRKTYRTRGIVLRHAPIGEADRIVTIFTPELGKLRAVARGVRRTRSKLSGHLEPLTYVALSISHGRTLDVVTEAQTVRSFRGLREGLKLMSKALYIAELADAFLTENEAGHDLFRLLLDCLDALESSAEPSRLLPWYEVRVLGLSGFRPELHECVECRTVLEAGDYVYSSDLGGVVCDGCRALSVGAVLPLSLGANKVLRYYERREMGEAIELAVPQPLSREVSRVLRSYIRHVLERELRSVEFMDLVAG